MSLSLTWPTPLIGARVVVRPVETRDLPDLLVVNGNEEVTRYLPYATWSSMADARAWLALAQAAQATGNTLQWVVVEKSTQTVMGACLLFQYDAASARAELGYVLGRPWWGRGLMQDALTAVLDCAFSRLHLRRIEAEVDPRNVASGRLLKTLGFTSEGILRERSITKGRACDVESFGLLQRDWITLKSRPFQESTIPLDT